ncbi:MAG: HAMP domain-containing histidine kinase [Bacteroidetes bacterium]|nr:HAMP domain-containing histidine kinase [Bacteroidota bacterium]
MQKTVQFLLFSFSFLICTVSALAQKKYDIQYFTVESDVTGMQRDDNNEFVWIATENGLIRFDGLHIVPFNSGNCSFMVRDRIKMLGKNEKGGIFAANSVNIFLVEDNKLKPYEKKTNIKYYGENLFNKIVSLYVGRKTVPKIHSYNYDSKVFPLDDSAYLIQNGNTLCGYNVSGISPFYKKNVANSAYLFKIDSDLFMLNEKNEFILIDPIKDTEEKIAIDGPAEITDKKNRAIYWQAGEEKPILICGTKAWTIGYKDNKITLTLICSQVPTGAQIRYAEYDTKDEILILATDKKSIIVIHATLFINSVKKSNADPNEINSYYGQIELANSNVLTNNGDIIGSKTENTLPVKEFDYNNYVIKDHDIWYTLHDSLFSYNNIEQKRNFHFKVNAGKYFVIAEMNNQLYFADINGIGLLYDTGLYYIHKNTVEQQENEFPTTMTALSPGVLGIGKSTGLFSYSTTTNKIDTIVVTKNTVETIWKSGNYIFVGTDGDGYYIYKMGGNALQMPLDKSNYLLNVHCIIPDDYGYVWLSTNRGLYKANRNDLIKAFEKNSPQVYYHFFGKNDGMDVVGINGGCEPCALKLKNGKLSFPTVNGLLWVDPKAPMRLPEGNIFIDKITVDGKTVNKDSFSYNSLPYTTHDITVAISFPAWCNMENLNLQYQIYPNSTRWELIMLRTPIIHISSLPPGSYTLRIRKLNGFGLNNYTYKEINFTIAKPWYRTYKFYFLCVLLGIGIVILSFRLTTKRYKRRQIKLQKLVDKKTKEIRESNKELAKNVQVQTRLISIISHDIITPLRFLHMVSKNLMEKKTQMPEPLQNETISEIATTANELEILSTNILNWIKYNKEGKKLNASAINLRDLVEEIFGVFKIIVKRKNISLVNNIGSADKIIQYPEPLKIVIYNLLVNAINFSENGSITVDSKRSATGIFITVTDEGVGMTQEQITNVLNDEYVISSENVDKKKGNGLGYLIIKDLVKIMGATIHIQSEKMKGTTVQVNIPEKKHEDN